MSGVSTSTRKTSLRGNRGRLRPFQPAGSRLPWLLAFAAVWFVSAILPASRAHTLPISYLKLVANADYLHLELIFNPLELTFISEVDTNKDGELDPEELRTKGSIVATRMTDALKLSVNGRAVKAESHGMDPDMTGHHVRLRAHYKVDARDQPVTIASELKSITSSSHLVQAAFHNGSRRELAQLDSHSSTVTFNATASKEKPAPPPQKAQGLLSRKPKTKEK